MNHQSSSLAQRQANYILGSALTFDVECGHVAGSEPCIMQMNKDRYPVFAKNTLSLIRLLTVLVSAGTLDPRVPLYFEYPVSSRPFSLLICID